MFLILTHQVPVGFSQEESLEDIPSNLVVVQDVSLVVRKPGYSSVVTVFATNPGEKNFKKFKKVTSFTVFYCYLNDKNKIVITF